MRVETYFYAPDGWVHVDHYPKRGSRLNQLHFSFVKRVIQLEGDTSFRPHVVGDFTVL